LDSQSLDEILTKKCNLTLCSKIIVGVSAGPDSMALLHLLHGSSLDLDLTCVYIDHGLRPAETVHEKKVIEKYCHRLDVNFEIIAINPLKHRADHKTSLEESCRILRYQVFEKLNTEYDADAIAVGHTADEQAEEVLLRLIRGTGLAGLSGMKMKSGSLIRPLLTTGKNTILNYLDDNNIEYCIDSSNSDTTFLRNRIRAELLPLLQKSYNDSIRSTLQRTADIVREDDDFIEVIARKELARCLVISGSPDRFLPLISINLPLFIENHKAIQRRIMEKCCWKSGSKPNFIQINELCRLACAGKTGAELHLAEGLRAVKTAENLCFIKTKSRQSIHERAKTIPFEPIQIEDCGVLDIDHFGMRLEIKYLNKRPLQLLKNELLLDAEKIAFPLMLRPFYPGEKFTPSGMPGRKKIARFLSDNKIPQYMRNRYPVIDTKGHVAAIAGIRADEKFTPTEKSKNFILFTWHQLIDA